MKFKHLVRAATFGALCCSGAAQAVLIDRGNGMVYDSWLDMTWLTDANYAKTSGHHATGLMNWQDATDWAANLEYAGYSDWRLAGVDPDDYTCIPSVGYGFGCKGDQNELAGMFSNHLGLHGQRLDIYEIDPDWHRTPAHQAISNSYLDFMTWQFKSVNNLMSGIYWSATPSHSDGIARYFDTEYGFQSELETFQFGYAWAVRSGDVAVVQPPVTPVSAPTSLGVFMLALFSAFWLNRRSAR
jgi:hypothetical protein